jgi:hypothetical protein
VIVGEAHVRDVIDGTQPHVGVMRLSDRHRITTVREAQDRVSRVSPMAIFQSVRLSEALSILRDLRVTPPEAPNTLLHAALGACFERLNPEDAHRAMVKTLKHSRGMASLSDLVDRLPRSLQPAALSVQIRRKDHERLVEAIKTPLRTALTWM